MVQQEIPPSWLPALKQVAARSPASPIAHGQIAAPRYVPPVYIEPLPHTLESLRFPFPALASLAGRLPLGGGREVALAALLVARLSRCLLPSEGLPVADRVSRASNARVWIASLALPSATRPPFVRCVDTTTGTALQAAGALRSLLAVISSQLDEPSVREMERLARQLGGI